MTRAEFHPEFVRFALKHVADEKAPDLAAWPHSEADFLRVQKKVREILAEVDLAFVKSS